MVYSPNRNVDQVPDSPDIYEQYPIATFTADGGEPIAFLACDIRESGGNRLVQRGRPFRDGAKIDDTGSLPFTWDITAEFNNDLNEEGLTDINGSTPLYPDVVNNLIAAFNVHETGDMVIPTRGTVRVRIDSFNRTETTDKVDTAVLTFTVHQDNEDDVNADSFGNPTVQANVVTVSEIAETTGQADAIWNSDFRSLASLTRSIETLANAPAEQAKDLEQQVNGAMGATRRILNAFRQPGTSGRNQFSDPDSSTTEIKLQQILEMAGRTRVAESLDRPPLRTVTFDRDQSLSSIAAMLNVDYVALMRANPDFFNPNYIPKNTPVRIPDEKIRRQG